MRGQEGRRGEWSGEQGSGEKGRRGTPVPVYSSLNASGRWVCYAKATELIRYSRHVNMHTYDEALRRRGEGAHCGALPYPLPLPLVAQHAVVTLVLPPPTSALEW